MTPWIVVLAVGIGTYALRAVTFLVVGARQLPAWTERPLAFVGPAAIGALVGGLLLTSHGRIEVARPTELLAVAATFAVVRRTGNVAHGLAVGLVVLWTVALLVG